MTRIYWANALFSEADRAFNEHCVAALRDAGFIVFSPQENIHNAVGASVSDEAIFVADTRILWECDCVVAVLDQEAIDAGVACEVGLAYAAGLPIVALYTDIRQFRVGHGRMYKNLFVLGAVLASGGVVQTTLGDVLKWLLTHFGAPARETVARAVIDHFDKRSEAYETYVERLESWYRPAWHPSDCLIRVLRGRPASAILDYGCGPGRLFPTLRQLYPDAQYVGYDGSPRATALAEGSRSGNAIWTAAPGELRALAGDHGFDVVLAFFVLHDDPCLVQTCKGLSDLLAPRGCLVILDLSVDDLPSITAFVRRTLARPLRSLDPRLSAPLVGQLAEACKVRPIVSEDIVFQVRFPTAADVDFYLDFFDVYSGRDLPLGLLPDGRDRARRLVQDALLEALFPWTDLRAFKLLVLERAS